MRIEARDITLSYGARVALDGVARRSKPAR